MKDNELLVFNGGNEGLSILLNVLKNQKKTDIWRRCYTKEMIVHPLYNYPIGLPLLREELNIPCDDDFLISCMENDYKPLLLEFPLEKMVCFPMRSTAYSSLCGRGHISGTVLQKMTSEDFCKVINICLQQWGDSSLVLYRDDKISAVHSGDANDYSVLVMYDLLKTMKNGLETLCQSSNNAYYQFAGGFLDHSMCSANFFVYEKEIMDFYEPYLDKMGYGNTDKFYPFVKFASSDVGVCGANITPGISNGRTEILIGTPLSLKHKLKASIHDFEENVSSVFALFRSTLKDFDKMEKTVIEYPEECFMNLCKKVQVSGRCTDAFIDFQNTRGKTTNALELYFAICEIITYMKNSGEAENKIFKEQEKIARILSLNIKSYDKPDLSNK